MNNETFFYDAALRNLKLKRSFFPLYLRTKLPYSPLLPGFESGHPQWKPFQERHPTREEVEAWRVQSKNRANIALVTGKISGILAVDIDFDKGGKATWSGLTGGRTINTETTKSGNGIHVKFKHPGGNISRLREALTGIHLRCDGAYIVDVPSVHRNRKRYETVIEAPLCEAPRWLMELLLIEDAGDSIAAKPVRKSREVTDAQVRAILNRYKAKFEANFEYPLTSREKPKPKPNSKYESLSNFDQAIIQALYNAGLADDLFPEILEEAIFPTKYRWRLENFGRHRAYIYLDYCMDSAAKLTDSLQAQAVVKKSAEMRRYLSKNPFQGTTALSDQFVLEAHISCYEKAKHEPWFISVRDLAEKSGYSYSTCSKSNKRLIKAGFIRLHTRGKGKAASLWNWGRNWGLDFDNVTPPQGASDVRRCHAREINPDKIDPHLPPAHEELNTDFTEGGATRNQIGAGRSPVDEVPTYGVFGHEGVFSKAAESIWRCLWDYADDRGLTRAEITKRTRRSPSTVSKAVKRMSEYSVLFETGRHYHVNREFDFKKLAADFGTELNLERTRRIHTAQRLQYREMRAYRQRSTSIDSTPDKETARTP